jgi:asparagine synthase (glutamine-hydrolysing)
VLTGEGSDEIFAGYPHYRRDLILQMAKHDPERAKSALAELERANVVSSGLLLPHGETASIAAIAGALNGFVPTWIEATASVALKLRPLRSAEFERYIGERDPMAYLMSTIEVSRQLRGRHVMHQSMYLWTKTSLPGYLLSALGDRMEMAHSVEGRLPFLDHRVAEVARELPVELLVREGIEKYALREVVKERITDEVYRRQKHPFLAPPASCNPDGPLYEMMQDTLRGAALRDLPFYDVAKVVQVLDVLPQLDEATRTALDRLLLTVLSLCLMQKRFGLS